MARIKDPSHPLTRGKLSKKSDRVYRVRNGKQQEYTPSPNTKPASAKQKAHRARHGKINAILNALLADPQQAAALDNERLAYNSSIDLSVYPPIKRFVTAREYGYYKIGKQLDEQTTGKQRKATAKTALPRGLKLYIKPFADLSAAEVYEILKSRFAVFVLEQGIRYLDEDNIDLTATHLALHRKGLVVAYARLFEDFSDNPPQYDATGRPIATPRVLRAGRMLTTEHGKGYGRTIILHLIEEAKRQGADILRIHAQMDAVPFYRHFRFAKVGEPFEEAGIQHIVMERKLTKSATK